jgi:hypothetical protein
LKSWFYLNLKGLPQEKTTMRSNKSQKFMLDDIGGSFTPSSTGNLSALQTATKPSLAQPDTALGELYAPPLSIRHKKLSPKAISHRLKAKHLAEQRLLHISDELFNLADEIRYINPLMAEALDEAWESTEEAIEMLSRDDVW